MTYALEIELEEKIAGSVIEEGFVRKLKAELNSLKTEKTSISFGLINLNDSSKLLPCMVDALNLIEQDKNRVNKVSEEMRKQMLEYGVQIPFPNFI